MLKVALVQQPCSADVVANQASSEHEVRLAAARGAGLVVLQELHSGLYFCQSEDTAQFDLAEPLDGPTMKNSTSLRAMPAASYRAFGPSRPGSASWACWCAGISGTRKPRA